MRLILFDFDSTLITVESLDVAARLALAGAADAAARLARIEAITVEAMEGRLPFDEALAQRLKLLSLDRATVARAGREIARCATADAARLIRALSARGDRAAVVSGGFIELIGDAAAACGVSASDLHANRFLFEGDRVAGADMARPLSRPGGKIETARRLRREAGAQEIIMVGDGATDLEVYEAGAADRFIAYTEHASRKAVTARAPETAASMAALAKLIL